jgi:hypothetical protein
MATTPLNQPITALTVGDLKELIREVIREEQAKGYYITHDGLKVRYEEEQIDDDYLEELKADFDAIQSGTANLLDAEDVWKKLGM